MCVCVRAWGWGGLATAVPPDWFLSSHSEMSAVLSTVLPNTHLCVVLQRIDGEVNVEVKSQFLSRSIFRPHGFRHNLVPQQEEISSLSFLKQFYQSSL